MPRVLFISRAYPPTLGGIEKQNQSIHDELSRIDDVTLIANTRGKKFLPLFFPFALLRSLTYLHRFDVILLGDGALAPLGWLLSLISGKPVVSIIHGLDVTFASRFYQAVFVRFALKRMHKLIAVGNDTIRQAVVRGVARERCVYVPNGVDPALKTAGRQQALDQLHLNANDIHLLTLGRLVRRKGVAWFVNNVMQLLPENIVYLVAGDGPDRPAIELAIQEKQLDERVRLLGRVSEEDKLLLYSAADVFVQPNIPVEGDMEGFGLVVLEAGSYGLPVVASRLEGLKDAILDGSNGMLVNPLDQAAYRESILRLADDVDYRQGLGERAKAYVAQHLGWRKIARQYHDEISKILSQP
jgi:phosphatidylinositol alpha-1,6-mannosyltransferase